MRKYVEKCVREAQDRLGPVLKDLKLTLYVETNSHDTAIFFRGTSGTKYNEYTRPKSPVTLRFPLPEKIVGEEARWQDAELCIDDWTLKPLGNTGWTHRRWWGFDAYDIERSDEEIFAWIESLIREQGVFSYEGPQQGIVDSPEVADLYWLIEDYLDDLAVVRIQIPDEAAQEEREALTFQDCHGRRVHIVPGDVSTVLFDGEIAAKFRCEISSLASFVDDLMEGDYYAPSDRAPSQ